MINNAPQSFHKTKFTKWFLICKLVNFINQCYEFNGTFCKQMMCAIFVKGGTFEIEREIEIERESVEKDLSVDGCLIYLCRSLGTHKMGSHILSTKVDSLARSYLID